ncbi:hypothetical protein EW146_g8068, partial [Bondarzewia mesenterica]
MLQYFHEPPTLSTMAIARQDLDDTRKQLEDAQHKIHAAEAQLAQLVSETRCVIDEMESQRAALEEKLSQMLAYIAPIRRLPQELLRHIFLMNFEEYPCCAWILAAVCTLWRRLALSMPKIWSKIRLVTSPNSSADTIRLWLERSGSRVPLDIEIFLQVQTSSAASTVSRRRIRSPSPWTYPNPPSSTTQYVQISAGQPSTSIQIFPTSAPIILPPSPTHHEAWGPLTPPPAPPPMLPIINPSPARAQASRASTHWGHIAIFYLVEQMERWERFVFRFDKQFSSSAALKSITGDAPLLKEFEVSCAEPIFFGDWPWLPSAGQGTHNSLPHLKSLTLQYTPFKWSSPMLRTNLRRLNLRALPTLGVPLDRILHIAANNPALEELTLHFSNVTNPVLPLAAATFPELKSLSIGGHYLMTSLVDALVLPALDALTLDMEARDPIEESILGLLARSNHPPIRALSIAYGGTGSPYYYTATALVSSWNFLVELNHLRSLHVGSTPLDPLLTALGVPEDDSQPWACPNLEHLALKGCPAHADGAAKLVQMIEGRNPDAMAATSSSGVGVTKLRHLEMYDCATLGPDVVQWVKGKVNEVVCIEPAMERCGYPVDDAKVVLIRIYVSRPPILSPQSVSDYSLYFPFAQHNQFDLEAQILYRAQFNMFHDGQIPSHAVVHNGIASSSNRAPIPSIPATGAVITSSTDTPASTAIEWDWDMEHEDRRREAKASAAQHNAQPFLVDRKLLKDVVREKMDCEVGRITFLSSGTFHKAYLVQLTDGREVIARVARRYMPRIKTESEVATMDYIRTYTNIPVPDVYFYDSNPYNRLGGEYILMSKAKGVPLSTVYHAMPHATLIALLDNIAALVIPLYAHRFSSIGSLYFGPPPDAPSPRPSSSSIPTPTASIPFSFMMSSTTPKAGAQTVQTPKPNTATPAFPEFHVGQIISWPFFGSNRGDLSHPTEIDRGPWSSTQAYLVSCADREIHGAIREGEGKAAPHRLHLDPDEIHSSRHHHLQAVPDDKSDESDEWEMEDSDDEWDGPGDAMYRDYRRMQRSTFLVAHIHRREKLVREEMARWIRMMDRLGVGTGDPGGGAEEFGLDCHDLSLENVFVDANDHSKI